MGIARRSNADLGTAESIWDDLRRIRSRGGFSGSVADDVVGVMACAQQEDWRVARDELETAIAAALDEIRVSDDPANPLRALAAESLCGVLFQDPPIPRGIGSVREALAKTQFHTVEAIRDAEDRLLRSMAGTIHQKISEGGTVSSKYVEWIEQVYDSIDQLLHSIGHGGEPFRGPPLDILTTDDTEMSSAKSASVFLMSSLEKLARLLQLCRPYGRDAFLAIEQTGEIPDFMTLEGWCATMSSALTFDEEFIDKLLVIYTQGSGRAPGRITFCESSDLAVLIFWARIVRSHHDQSTCPGLGVRGSDDGLECSFHELVSLLHFGFVVFGLTLGKIDDSSVDAALDPEGTYERKRAAVSVSLSRVSSTE